MLDPDGPADVLEHRIKACRLVSHNERKRFIYGRFLELCAAVEHERIEIILREPLLVFGELIENFSVRFEKGKAVEVHAEKGEELLKQMIAMDPNACYLGEVALIPFDSPINNTGIIFYNTLYDENAACHLALGMGFTNVIKNYEKYSQEQLHEMGINDSSIHVDFMIGDKDLNITGYTRDGKAVPIFRNGNWAF